MTAQRLCHSSSLEQFVACGICRHYTVYDRLQPLVLMPEEILFHNGGISYITPYAGVVLLHWYRDSTFLHTVSYLVLSN